MDLGFSIQARSVRALARWPEAFEPGAQAVPDEINRLPAREMLRTLSAARVG